MYICISNRKGIVSFFCFVPLTDSPCPCGLGCLDAHAPVPTAQVEKHLMMMMMIEWGGSSVGGVGRLIRT
jgi:hypothetical protein